MNATATRAATYSDDLNTQAACNVAEAVYWRLMANPFGAHVHTAETLAAVATLTESRQNVAWSRSLMAAINDSLETLATLAPMPADLVADRVMQSAHTAKRRTL